MGELGKRTVRLLELRNFSVRTKKAYLHHLKELYYFYNRPLESLGSDELEQYLHHLRYEKRLSWSNVNIAISALKFLYGTVLGRSMTLAKIPHPRPEHKLPLVLSPEEVAAIFKQIINPKHRLFFMTIYSAGLRISEACQLKKTDIDRKRMQIRIRGGKGNKDRYTLLSPRLLEEFRHYCNWSRQDCWLFPSEQTGNQPVTVSSMQKAFQKAKKKPLLTSPFRYTPCAIVSPPTL